jgi:ribosomal protein S18 acetylase RimI-like enzyme
MVQMTTRAYADTHDRTAVLELLRTVRVTAAVDRYPTRSRLELLLSLRLQEPARDARMWLDTSGTPLGFAALLRRTPDSATATPTLLVHPRLAGGGLEEEMLVWCEARAALWTAARGAVTAVEALACEDETATRDRLLRHGFAPRAGVHNVYLVRPLDVPLQDRLGVAPPPLPLPGGYVVRHLAGTHELDAYEALYSFAPMRHDHRLALLRDPGYAHLVVVAPDGTLAAFCECSVDAGEWARGGRRTGWVDYLGTRAELRGRSLGRAALLEGLAWMHRQGAERAALVTMSSNAPALRLYGAAGFREVAKEHVYVRASAPDEDAGVRT